MLRTKAISCGLRLAVARFRPSRDIEYLFRDSLEVGIRYRAEITGLPYSGEYGFANTTMFWPQTHMVAPKTVALQCQACHSEGGRMDWEALGYPGDPIKWGSRERVRAGDAGLTQAGAE